MRELGANDTPHARPVAAALRERLRSGVALAGAAARYWLLVFPRVCVELRRARRLARHIVEPPVRDAALAALAKRSNIEGAAAFAAIGPLRRNTSAVRALVAFQTLYNHADMTAERFAGGSIERAERAHAPLLAVFAQSGTALAAATGPGAGDADRPNRAGGAATAAAERNAVDGADAEYVAALVGTCRDALSRLPSNAAIALAARRATERIVAFQSLSFGADGELERWAREVTPERSALRWSEIAASAGSSLGVHALVAAAAAPSLDAHAVAAIDGAYFPTIGALHSLLDSLVDLDEDIATGQLRLIDCYRSQSEAAAALARLTGAALARARALPRGRSTELLVAAMACSYLATPGAATPAAEPIARAVRQSLGWIATPLLRVFALRRAAASRPVSALRRVLTGRAERRTTAVAPGADRAPAPISAEPCEQGANARAA